MDDLYIRLEWPLTQEFMDFDWFENECVLDNREGVTPSSYFIPIERYNEVCEILGYEQINVI